MISENVKALVQYRLEQADESIEAASVLLDKHIFRRSVNSAYYAMFYAVMALLAIKKRKRPRSMVVQSGCSTANL